MAIRLSVAAFAAALVLAVTLSNPAGPASAHERRAVGNYEFEVGFLVEPAVANNLNGVFMGIAFYAEGAPETAGGDEDGGDEGDPVQGADQTLSVNVSVGGGAATTELEFEPLEDAGSYNAAFIPTLAGDYTFRITGELDGTEIDETFESGPNTFEPVVDPAELEFPAQTDEGGDSSSSTADPGGEDDDDTSTIALIIGLLAIGAAAVAIILGLVALARKASG